MANLRRNFQNLRNRDDRGSRENNRERNRGSRSIQARQQQQPQQANNNLPSYPTSYFAPLSSFFSELDQVFSNSFRNFGLPGIADFDNLLDMQDMFIPNIDIASNDNEYSITVEVPGMDEKDINLDISEDGILCISGEKRSDNQDRRRDAERTECSYGAFERILSLPDDVDLSNIQANFRNGVLNITCPRTGESRNVSRQIPINSDRRAIEGSRSANSERGIERGSAQSQKRAA
jgi:HSP20 family protein